MSNRKYSPDQKKTHQIIEEVTGKIKTYESRMTGRLSRWTEVAELYSGKSATQKENAKLSANSVELYKAVRAISNMQYRMLTGQKPWFELECLDLIGYEEPEKLLKAEHYITNQLELSRFNKGLYRALVQLNLYGTVAIHEQYEPLRASFLGKKRYITSYRPVSLINCAFALDAYDIEESGWTAISDVQARSVLDKIKEHDPEEKLYNFTGVNAALNAKDYIPQVNEWVSQRMNWSGYTEDNFSGGMERTTYYGPLDCMNDHEEYSVEIVNREFIIRMESYDGIKPVRVAAINTLDIEPHGTGLGDQFGGELGKIDDSECALQNMITLAGANMFSKQKSLADEDSEYRISNFAIIGFENPDLGSIAPNPNNLSAVAAYREAKVQGFRQGSGATDVLQAIIPDERVTATVSSLAMNESVRNLSVMSEIIAPTLCADHVKIILQNAQKYNTEPFVLHIAGVPMTILPSDLFLDVNVRVKTTTDQDFRPAKMAKLREAIALMLQAGPTAIPGYKINAGPTLLEYLKTLDVPNFMESVKPITEEDLLQMRMMAEMQIPQGGQTPGNPGKLGQSYEMPEKSTLTTPAGEVMTAPGDEAQSTQAIREASVGGR